METKTFKVFYQEIETNVIVRGPIKVSEETHPELKGKTEEEVIKYVQEHAWEMKTSSEYYDSLGEELSDADVLKDKIIPESTEIIVEVSSSKNIEDDEDEDDFDDDDNDD